MRPSTRIGLFIISGKPRKSFFSCIFLAPRSHNSDGCEHSYDYGIYPSRTFRRSAFSIPSFSGLPHSDVFLNVTAGFSLERRQTTLHTYNHLPSFAATLPRSIRPLGRIPAPPRCASGSEAEMVNVQRCVSTKSPRTPRNSTKEVSKP